MLIVYFAKLGSSHPDSLIDLDYLETLIQSGAKVNYTDRYGQTVLHEVKGVLPRLSLFIQNEIVGIVGILQMDLLLCSQCHFEI